MTEIEGPVHLVGAGGIHISAIGQLLLARGIAVTGSDIRLSDLTAHLEELGAKIVEGHAAENVGDAKLVVHTAAAGDENPEILEAKRRGIEVVIRGEMVARLMEGKKVIAIAGSAGKTTTASMVAWVLKDAGKEPMYLLGGESLDLGGHAAWGAGEWCVVEADEYKNAFHEYEPDIAVITNVTPDHLDYFGTTDAYFDSFVTFARRVKPGGTLIICGADAGAERIRASLDGALFSVETYGLNPRDHWLAGTPHEIGERVAFEVVRQGGRVGDIVIHRPGMHMILNGLAAAAVCLHAGVEMDDIHSAAAKFKGAKRRFELKGEAGGVIVMDDYAHHPAKVRALLEAARVRFGGRRLIGVYQPHTYTRTAYLWDDWLTCFAGLDALIVVETYAAREEPQAGRSASDLARTLTQPPASYAADFAQAAKMAAELAKAGDVIFTIGAGDVTDVGPMILERLK